MPDTKLLQAILSGQTRIREDIKRVEDKFDKKIDIIEKKLTKRLDKIGGQLAYLEDDAPTREEHNQLEERVTKLEQNLCA